MNAKWLQLQLTREQIIASTDPIIFNKQINASPIFSYNKVSGEISINRIGTYYVDWVVILDDEPTSSGVNFAINNIGVGQIVGTAANEFGEVAGSAVIEVATPPAVLQLVNVTSNPVWIGAYFPIAAKIILRSSEYSGVLEPIEEKYFEETSEHTEDKAANDELGKVETDNTDPMNQIEVNNETDKMEATVVQGQEEGVLQPQQPNSEVLQGDQELAGQSEPQDISALQGEVGNAEEQEPIGLKKSEDLIGSQGLQGDTIQGSPMDIQASQEDTMKELLMVVQEIQKARAEEKYNIAQGLQLPTEQVVLIKSQEGQIESRQEPTIDTETSQEDSMKELLKVVQEVKKIAMENESTVIQHSQIPTEQVELIESQVSHVQTEQFESIESQVSQVQNEHVELIGSQGSQVPTDHAELLGSQVGQTESEQQSPLEIQKVHEEAKSEPLMEVEEAQKVTIKEEPLTVAQELHEVITPEIKVEQKASNTITTQLDYTEIFQWLDGNPNNEDRTGYFVTLDGEYIKKATSSDKFILGAILAAPDVIGNDKNKYQRVGVAGKLLVKDDGTCRVNGYCKPNDNGIATFSEFGFRVLKRITKRKIMILLLDRKEF